MLTLSPTRNQAISADQPIQETHVVCNIVAGVVTLVGACVLVKLWLKSKENELFDVPVNLPLFPDTPSRYSVEFSHRGIAWLVFTIAKGERIWIIPYWSIVIPLTLLSAWLLLSKPRAGKIEPTDSPSKTKP